MKKIISLVVSTFLVVSSYAQVDVLKLSADNMDGNNYLLSHVPAYCRATLGIEGNNLQVSTDVVNTGSTHSLLLDYSGSWESNLVENASWDPVDVSSYDQLKLTVYAPVALADNQIPSLVLVYTNDLLWDGKEKPLSNYLNPIPAGQWVEINIPLSELEVTQLAANTGVNLCCTGWPGAGENPGKLYIDKVQFASTASSLSDISLSSSKPYYANGQLRLNGYQGAFSLIDGLGRSVYSVKNASGDVAVNVPQGVYFVKTDKGVTKIVIP